MASRSAISWRASRSAFAKSTALPNGAAPTASIYPFKRPSSSSPTTLPPFPGRKIVLWISPGFPLLSGPGVYLTQLEEEQEIFGDVLYFSSTELRQGRITLYNLNPVGVNESLIRANYYEDFLKGVTRRENAQYADLSIQVLSAQSGGLDLISNNDLAQQIQKCLLDVDSWYEISFDPPPPDKPNEYHRIEVKLAQPGLIARTHNGYYSNTSTVERPH